ncbi:UDP-N-acetylmuramoylalanine--D-glutamate ligase [Pseudoalteromonas holothuriae]|uniref:UDP-N-acetylmuramoylalanine--D-glutamate ligase n=1 Tax=Pseudoalteromonas holothuriae TaxID=2963714 RepID=A0A9W4R2C9_9GAMM|nr:MULTISPECIES: UDP-N-acetylmuramoyl-L-alanine--D-glutamate ligase [unclassified Pseudoalteromonas]CAH9063525.1 UDP-N-acetylmuramoylalanine--D-glutamate ligase [Pseudoalteromonas sp. CIP111854]CAH9064843.1 UDP-N-acetylmuramoylalanine--D-glutamate ligase [Pseudoalteromonas sp. CIP111951]
MQYLNVLKNKNITVLGLGVTGLGIVRFLLSHNILPRIVDSRPVPPGAHWLAENAPECEAVFGPLAQASLSSTDMIIISPGIALYEATVASAISDGVEVIGDIELFARLNDKPVIAVTGSNGKSTVVTLAAQVLTQAGMKVGLGGNIGTAALDLLHQDYDVFVLELSSFQLETTHSLYCTSAMILNITEDHMDRYPDFAAYCAAKQRIYKHTEHLVYNAADKNTFNSAQQGVSVGLSGGDYQVAKHRGEYYFSVHGQLLLPVSCMALQGKHNQFNALAVMALLAPISLPASAFERAFAQFKGLAHRCQLVADVQGIKYFNDSKATNVGATVAALESLEAEHGKIILIVGGDAKGADLSPLTEPMKKHCKAIYGFGKDGSLFLSLHRYSHLVATLEEAVKQAQAIASNGDCILLAPACASIDMYPNYMVRGEEFCRLVGEITKW